MEKSACSQYVKQGDTTRASSSTKIRTVCQRNEENGSSKLVRSLGAAEFIGIVKGQRALHSALGDQIGGVLLNPWSRFEPESFTTRVRNNDDEGQRKARRNPAARANPLTHHPSPNTPHPPPPPHHPPPHPHPLPPHPPPHPPTTPHSPPPPPPPCTRL